jgi:hypothetical protein
VREHDGMSEDEELDPEELEQQQAEELPDRELMSLIDLPGQGLAPPEFDENA